MVKIVIETLPGNGGSPITAVQYRRNGGAAVSLPSPTPGEYDTPAQPGEEVEIRAVNAIGPGPWSNPKVFNPALTTFAREYTTEIGEVTVNLAGIGPAESGTATYALQGTPAGMSVTGATLTIDTDTAASGTITIRRSDDTGLRDLVLTLTLVTASISVTGDAAAVTVGADDPGTTEYSFDITGGAYDGETLTFTKAQLVVIEDGQGRPVLPPEIDLTTDADSDGELDPDDVAALARPGLRVHPSGQSAPLINGEWHIDGVATGVMSSTFTDSDPEGDELTYVETDGATPSPSNAIPVAAAAQFLLDALTTAEMAYSVRKLRAAYSGPAIRVRRSSDNTQQDIGFDSSGYLDTAALLVFAGSGDAFLTTWYDQTTGGRHMTQSTTSRQPRIVLAGVLEIMPGTTRAGVFFIEPNGQLLETATGQTVTVNTMNAVVARGSVDGQRAIFHLANQGGGSSGRMQINNSTTGHRLEAWKGSSTVAVANTAPTTRFIATYVGQDGGSARLFRNGTQLGTAAEAANGNSLGGTDRHRIGAITSAGGTRFSGHISELICFSTSLSTADRGTLESNQTTYFA